jgi:UTP-glucose-1-phosphate uridylyltransferase
MKPTLVIMAAGMGSRYGGLKQIDPVGPAGEIVLDYSVFDAIRTGFGKVVFVIREDIEQAFKEAVGAKYKGQIEVDYAFQRLSDLPAGYSVPEGREKPWGTAHAVLSCQDQIDTPFAVINADDFYGRQSFETLSQELQSFPADELKSCLIGFTLRNTLSDHGSVARGICELDDKGQLVDIVERLKIEKVGEHARDNVDGEYIELSADEVCSMNMWGFTPPIFAEMENYFKAFLDEKIAVPKSEFLIPEVVADLMKDKGMRVDVLESKAQWLGVTYSEDKPLVQAGIRRLVDEGEYPASLWER